MSQPPPALPSTIARCSPSKPCHQREHCARARIDRVCEVDVIDASVALKRPSWKRGGPPCQLFIDQRGIALLAAA